MKIYSVSELNNEARETILLKFEFPISVRGEMTDYRESRGHQYFKLRDNDTSNTISCVMWKNSPSAQNLNEYLHSDIVISAKVDFYVGFGSFQLNVIDVTEFGEGFLRKEIERKKNKLLKEGIFDNKKEIPIYPSRIGILTAQNSDALRDVVSKLKERYPVANLYIYPSVVQGPTAAKNMINQLKNIGSLSEIDVLLIVRGGGSLQDLMAFNDEELVREIAQSKIPTITGIGHKPDITLADYAADSSQETPTAAAVKCVPDKSMLIQDIIQQEIRIENRLVSVLNTLSDRLNNYRQLLKLYSPRRLFESYTHTANESKKKLAMIIKTIIASISERTIIKREELDNVLDKIVMKYNFYDENLSLKRKSLKSAINYTYMAYKNSLEIKHQNISIKSR